MGANKIVSGQDFLTRFPFERWKDVARGFELRGNCVAKEAHTRANRRRLLRAKPCH